MLSLDHCFARMFSSFYGLQRCFLYRGQALCNVIAGVSRGPTVDVEDTPKENASGALAWLHQCDTEECRGLL